MANYNDSNNSNEKQIISTSSFWSTRYIMLTIIVCLILSIIFMLYLPKSYERGNDDLLKHDLQSIDFALERFHSDNDSYPIHLNDLASKYITSIPKDIKGNSLVYTLQSNNTYDLYGTSSKEEILYSPGSISFKNWDKRTDADKMTNDLSFVDKCILQYYHDHKAYPKDLTILIPTYLMNIPNDSTNSVFVYEYLPTGYNLYGFTQYKQSKVKVYSSNSKINFP